MSAETPPQTQDIPPIAMPGTHQKFLPFFQQRVSSQPVKVLDVGAGYGAFSKQLYEMGYDVHACDLFPEIFRFEPVECRKVNIIEGFPYEDNSFDVAIAIEVMEHIYDHENFFREVNRILKPGGQLFISTPNILSLKSRVRYLFTGFFYSFKPLDLHNYDGLQHVASLTFDQYNYVAIKNGFEPAIVDIDREQSSSRWLLALYPLMWLYRTLKKVGPMHNSRKLMLGRLLFLLFVNQPSDT